MLCVCVGDVMDVVFSVCIVRRGFFHQLLINGICTIPSKPKRPVLPPVTEGDTSKVYPVSEGKYNKGVAALKNNKAADRDGILV